MCDTPLLKGSLISSLDWETSALVVEQTADTAVDLTG
jgi:hypothetical protein